MPLGSIPSKVFDTNNWRSYSFILFYLKLLQINYNNQMGCYRVSHVLKFVQSSYWRSMQRRGLLQDQVLLGLDQRSNYRLVS